MMKSYFDDYCTAVDAVVADTGKNAAQHLMSYWHRFRDAGGDESRNHRARQ
jgi:TetR/AcrR family transcriptional repressor of nem operon